MLLYTYQKKKKRRKLGKLGRFEDKGRKTKKEGCNVRAACSYEIESGRAMAWDAEAMAYSARVPGRKM